MLPSPRRTLNQNRTMATMAKKDQQLTVRVTAGEKQEIERQAGKAGRSVSRFLVESALEEDLMSSEEREELAEELRELHGEIHPALSNVNQIAYRLNRGDRVSDEAIAAALEAAEQASELVKEKLAEIL